MWRGGIASVSSKSGTNGSKVEKRRLDADCMDLQFLERERQRIRFERRRERYGIQRERVELRR